MKKFILPGFVALALLQWAVPVTMIVGHEKVLASGKEFRFLTEPVDPAHPFQGRYIVLNFKESRFTTTDSGFKSGQPLFVELAEDDKGFAIVKNISLQVPKNAGGQYVEARVTYIGSTGDSSEVHFGYPFDRFYLNEYKAPEAEREFREAQLDSSKTTYALVQVLNGKAVVKNVYINGKPVLGSD